MKHNYPESLFVVGHETSNGPMTGCLRAREPKEKKLDDEVSLLLDRGAAVDDVTGKHEGYTQEGILAVYRLVEIVEVRQKRIVTTHKVGGKKKRGQA